MPDTSHITLSEKTIHRPDEPRHFMRIRPIERKITVWRGDLKLAETQAALRLQEVGRDVYEPAIYIPEQDLTASFRPTDKTTHCPLKGDASYLSLTNSGGGVLAENLAWRYESPLDFAPELKGYVSFYTDTLRIEEAPLDA